MIDKLSHFFMILLLCRDNFVTANIFDEDNFDILWTKATRADTTLAVGPFGSDPVILRNVIECALENAAVLKIFFKRNRATFQEISFFEGRVYKYSNEGFDKFVAALRLRFVGVSAGGAHPLT